MYRLFAKELPTLLQQIDLDESRFLLPAFVRWTLWSFLDCGVLVRGFARVRCQSCGVGEFVAFSCKKRGICCPSREPYPVLLEAARPVLK